MEQDNPPNKHKTIKVRIPPSPTGVMHIGTARTALFNYLFARQNQGKIVLRLEDSDRQRSKPEFVQDIFECLKKLNITYDEGPYYQSQRTEIYKKYLQMLLDKDLAYWCFCSPEELEAEKQYKMSQGEAPIYSGKCSLLTRQEAEALIKQGRRAVLRFRTPKKKIYFIDKVRGKIEFDGALIGDFVIAKDLDNALYNFLVVVDDFEMGITHIIRGEDHISNTPKQIFIQEALNFPRPEYSHLPMVLGPDKTKLSKRHGAVGVAEYLKNGYLPEALINFIAFLGWNPGTDKEIYSIDELIRDFSLEKIQKGGAVFNIQRLDYLNGYYIRLKSVNELTQLCLPYWIDAQFIEPSNINSFIIKSSGETIDLAVLEKIIKTIQPRLKKLSDVCELTAYFFQNQLNCDKSLFKWKDESYDEVVKALTIAEDILSGINENDWNKQTLETLMAAQAEEFSLSINKSAKDRGYLLWPLRVSLCGQKMSPSPFEIAEILGKTKTLARLRCAKALILSLPAGKLL